jgi:hypothetical protein
MDPEIKERLDDFGQRVLDLEEKASRDRDAFISAIEKLLQITEIDDDRGQVVDLARKIRTLLDGLEG